MLVRLRERRMVRSGEENQGHFIEIQALDLGSIPIARSINPDGSVDLTRLSSLNSIKTRPVLDGGWTVLDSIGRSVFTGAFAVGANRQRAFGWWNGTNTGLLGWGLRVRSPPPLPVFSFSTKDLQIPRGSKRQQ